MRIFLTSTPPELERHRRAVRDVVRGAGHEITERDPAIADVREGVRPVGEASLVIALVGWLRGPVPAPENGGDGLSPWAVWEVRHALDNAKPVAALLSDGCEADVSQAKACEDDDDANAVMLDFRGLLSGVAVHFDDDSTDLREFRGQVARALSILDAEAPPPNVELRRYSPPAWPERPYPVLSSYTHPALLTGRDPEIEKLRRQLQRATPIVGLYAPSGSGKSSLLEGGLVPGLRADGWPVAFDRHPAEDGLPERLLGDLVESDGARGRVLDLVSLATTDLANVHRAAEGPPILVLDQFEDLFRPPARAARTQVGTLLAASVQRVPGLDGPPCRWVLAYRHEFHGEVVRWLRDVLTDARADGADLRLPHDLSGPERFQPWPLPLLASDDDADAVFLEAIAEPLEIEDDGRRRYPWRFETGHAERLARAFGEARRQRPNAPLVPELQVVLAHLMNHAPDPYDDDDGGPSVVTIEVPSDPAPLIDEALERHLKEALDKAFPTSDAATRLRRTRVLLALRELADVHGRRAVVPADLLARVIGGEGRDVLEKLATAGTRVVVATETEDGWSYALSHDRMAEVIVYLVDDEKAYAGLGVDDNLLRLRRLVVPQSRLFATEGDPQATALTAKNFRDIEANDDALLWSAEQRRWWEACRKRQRLDRRRRRLSWGAVAVLVLGLAAVVWYWADDYFSKQTKLKRMLLPSAETAFKALADLTAEGFDRARLLERVEKRTETRPDLIRMFSDEPMHSLDLLTRGLGGVAEEERGQAIVRVVALLRPWLAARPEDPVNVAATVWALDLVTARYPESADQARVARDGVLAPLRRRFPPPPPPSPDDPNWISVPTGTYVHGSPKGVGSKDEKPQHEVSLTAFRMLRHEVTNAEYRLLFPAHAAAADADLPVSSVDWYQAYTYAAWLGGRLPTEAEWEYAARAGCPHPYCRQDGTAGSVRDVAWIDVNSDFLPHPVMRLEPNPWGFYDMLGNLWEWVVDPHSAYPAAAVRDPWPVNDRRRVLRGGSFWSAADQVRLDNRVRDAPGNASPMVGFRVVLPVQ